MGARTLDNGMLLKYINVRRLLLMIERALETQLQWTVHEPNNETLWNDIERVVSSFLKRLFYLGMLDGATETDAYFVRCDSKTNQDITEEGKALCIVGVRLPYPVEFLLLRIGVTSDGILLEEQGEQHA